MRTKQYNPGNSIDRQKLVNLISIGKTVVCAPRPLPGEESWQGQWCCGVFWASGNLAQFQKQWEDLDATIVLLVNNESLLIAAEQEYQRRKDSRDPSKSLLREWEIWKTKRTDRELVKMVFPEAPWLN